MNLKIFALCSLFLIPGAGYPMKKFLPKEKPLIDWKHPRFDQAWLLTKGTVKLGLSVLFGYALYKGFEINNKIPLHADNFRPPINPTPYLASALIGDLKNLSIMIGAVGSTISGIQDLYHGLWHKKHINHQNCKYDELNRKLL